MTIGQRIKLQREKLGLSQDELARRLNYKSRSTINKIEMGINDITQSKISMFAKVLDTTPAYLMGWDDNNQSKNQKPPKKVIKIPVLGKVVAGYPIEAVENILDYEEISEELAKTGEFFALSIKGDSMEPKFSEGDVVIVRKQEDVESGDIAIIMVNGNEATVKKIQKFDGGINLIPSNNRYDIITYTNKEVLELPVRCLGKVVELRAKF